MPYSNVKITLGPNSQKGCGQSGVSHCRGLLVNTAAVF